MKDAVAPLPTVEEAGGKVQFCVRFALFCFFLAGLVQAENAMMGLAQFKLLPCFARSLGCRPAYITTIEGGCTTVDACVIHFAPELSTLRDSISNMF